MTTLPTRRQGRVPKVDSFSPELFQIWEKAPLSLTFNDDAVATTLRFRLYSLRSALSNSELDHHIMLFKKAAKMKISKTRRFDSITRKTVYDLKIYDADEAYKDVLEAAGVTVPDPPDLDL
jgi:hypothetical protein